MNISSSHFISYFLSILVEVISIAIFLSPSVAIYLPTLKLTRWTESDALKIITTYKSRSFNHDHVGYIMNMSKEPPPGFRLKEVNITIGKGLNHFNKATKIMESFAMVNELPWIKIIVEDKSLAIGSGVATMAHCFGLVWTLNPCRIVSHVQNKKIGNSKLLLGGKPVIRYSEISYSTLQGHLIAGEERFRVSLVKGQNGVEEVVFDVSSFSNGFGILGMISLPVIQPLQRLFFQDVTKTMSHLMKSM